MAESHDGISGFIRIREIPASELAFLPYDALCHVIVWQKGSLERSVPCIWLPRTQNPNNKNKNFLKSLSLIYFGIALNKG